LQSIYPSLSISIFISAFISTATSISLSLSIFTSTFIFVSLSLSLSLSLSTLISLLLVAAIFVFHSPTSFLPYFPLIFLNRPSQPYYLSDHFPLFYFLHFSISFQLQPQ
jgi:hypothetical protein